MHLTCNKSLLSLCTFRLVLVNNIELLLNNYPSEIRDELFNYDRIIAFFTWLESVLKSGSCPFSIDGIAFVLDNIT